VAISSQLGHALELRTLMRFPPVGRDQMGDGGAMRAIRAYWIDRFDPEEQPAERFVRSAINEGILPDEAERIATASVLLPAYRYRGDRAFRSPAIA
jgi:hypothetical protein